MNAYAIELLLWASFQIHFSENPEGTSLGGSDCRMNIYQKPFNAIIIVIIYQIDESLIFTIMKV